MSSGEQVLRVRARPLRGHPTLAAALAYRHPLLPRAENDTKLLAGGVLGHASWTDREVRLRCTDGRALCIVCSNGDVDWRS